MADQRAIGIFDSGIGGLTVARAISNLLPNERIIYFGDTEHMPYGEKSEEAIIYFSRKISSFLLMQDCKTIIIACNTASSVAFELLNEELGKQVKVYNVVDPIVEAVLKDEGMKRIGIIGTKQTIKSKVYETKILAKKPSISVKSFATPLLAQMIEEGFYDSEISKLIVKSYLDKANFINSDGIILACTHYPMIKNDLLSLFGYPVSIFDSTKHVAEYIKTDLEKSNLLADRKTEEDIFYVSDYTESFSDTARKFYKKAIDLKKIHLWEDPINA